MVSIIIPIFNTDKFLSRCLDSIISQSYSNWECLLVDDGSKDNSGIICDKYAQQDSRFVVFHKKNEGVSSARNFGIENASGEYICFIDSDDYIKSDFLSIMLKDKQYPLVVGGYERFGNSNEKFVPNTNIIDVIYDLSSFWNNNKSLNGWYFWYVWGKLFSTKIIKENNIRFIDTMKYSEDNVFVLNYISCIQKIKLVNKAMYMFFFPNTSRQDKYKLNYDEYKKHCDIQEDCFRKIEALVNTRFLNIRSNVYRRFILSFLSNLLIISSYNSFKNELLKFKEFSDYYILNITGRWRYYILQFKYLPIPFLFCLKTIIKYNLSLIIRIEKIIGRFITRK